MRVYACVYAYASLRARVRRRALACADAAPWDSPPGWGACGSRGGRMGASGSRGGVRLATCERMLRGWRRSLEALLRRSLPRRSRAPHDSRVGFDPFARLVSLHF